jgi:hypothetical protein
MIFSSFLSPIKIKIVKYETQSLQTHKTLQKKKKKKNREKEIHGSQSHMEIKSKMNLLKDWGYQMPCRVSSKREDECPPLWAGGLPGAGSPNGD